MFKEGEMPRRRWIKLWTQEFLYGTTSDELTLEQQAIWNKLLALAGDSPLPGILCLAPHIPYPFSSMAQVFHCTEESLGQTIELCASDKIDKMSQNGDGCWEIKNFWKYQPEFDRDEWYREYMRDYMRKRRQEEKQAED